MFELRSTTYFDIVELAPKLREIDKLECGTTDINKLEQRIVASVLSSEEPLTLLEDGMVVGITGLTLSGVIAFPWFLQSGEIDSVRGFAKISKLVTDQYKKESPLLLNMVMKDNKQSIRLLKYLGFSFIKEEGEWLHFAWMRPCILQDGVK